jgi:hypothetical protein
MDDEDDDYSRRRVGSRGGLNNTMGMGSSGGRNEDFEEIEKKDEIFSVNKLEFQYVLEEGIKQVESISEYLFIVTFKNTILVYDGERKMERGNSTNPFSF